MRPDPRDGRQVPRRAGAADLGTAPPWSTCRPTLRRSLPPSWPIFAAASRRSLLTASGSAALPILVIPPSNDAGFDPSRSFLPARTPRAEREAFTSDFLSALRLEDSDPASAIATYRSLLARQPDFAETHYRLAHLLEHSGGWEEAYGHYVAARNLDGLPIRALDSFQQAYRDVAARHDCVLVDGQALFHAIGAHGLLDDHLFEDAMHPSLQGHVALAQAILDALHTRGAFGWPRDAPAPAIDPAQCAAHFGFVPQDWQRICEWGATFYTAAAPMRYDPCQRTAKRRAFETAARRIAAGEPAETAGLPNVGVPAAVPTRLGFTAFAVAPPHG